MELPPPDVMQNQPEPKSVFEEEEDDEQHGDSGLISRRISARSSFAPIKSSIKALRTLSISSAMSNSSGHGGAPELKSPRSWLRSSMRKNSISISMAGAENKPGAGADLRRASKTSSDDYTEEGRASTSTRPTTPSAAGSPGTSVSGDALTVVKSGPLQGETALLTKTKKEYLVLTPVSLMKFKTRQAATEHFPQLAASTPATPVDLKDTGPSGPSGADVQVPLEKVVAVFKDEGTKPSFGIEVWCKDDVNESTFTSLELGLELPDDRDDWIRQIQYAVKYRTRIVSEERAPGNIEVEFAQLVEVKHPHLRNAHLDIFPVIPRRPYTRLRGNAGEVRRGWREGSSFYLAFSRNVCLLAQFSKSATGQKVNPSVVQFGLVTLSKVNASLNDERFDLIFRLPLDKPKQLELSSRYYRSIVARLFRADTYLKPAWPIWTRREVFFVDGDTQQMHLPEGDDYGGFKRTLDAFLEGYHCDPVSWKVTWRGGVRYPPEFRLLPPANKTTAKYTAHQLLAVFRALRFNDFFKSLSFRHVDFSALLGVYDNLNRLEPTAWLSRTGKRCLTREEFEVVENSSVLFQEIVGLLLPSESVKHMDLTGVLPELPPTPAFYPLERRGCEIVPPIYLLLKSLQSRCKSIVLSGNPMVPTDISELSRTLQNLAEFMKCIALSRCQLDDGCLSTLWDGIHAQRQSIEMLELADNTGRIDATRVSQTLLEAHKLRHLDLAHCLKGELEGPLFNPWVTSLYTDPWRLEHLDLSGWKINADTMTAFVKYLSVDESICLRHLVLSNCGITGETATAILRKVGGGRDLHLHLNGNPLEEISTDWIELIHGNEAPRMLHLDMVQFTREYNFNRLLMAMAHNETIEFLSMAGTGPPGRASSRTSDLLSLLFELNATLQYLDFSGYSGKLEDGHMGWGLSGALGGLRQNTTLRQLRIRNHDLGAAEHVTELCRVIAANQGLVMLDVRNNNFNHHQFGNLVTALRHNEQMVSFPLSPADRDYAVDHQRRLFVKHLTNSSPSSGKKAQNLSKSEEGRLDGLLTWLKGHWEAEARKVADTLRRNRESHANRALEFDVAYLEAWEDDDLPAWLIAKADSRDKCKEREMGLSSYLPGSLTPVPIHHHHTPRSASLETPRSVTFEGPKSASFEVPPVLFIPEMTFRSPRSSLVTASPLSTPRMSIFPVSTTSSPRSSTFPTPRASMGAPPPPSSSSSSQQQQQAPFAPVLNVLDAELQTYTIDEEDTPDEYGSTIDELGRASGGEAAGKGNKGEGPEGLREIEGGWI